MALVALCCKPAKQSGIVCSRHGLSVLIEKQKAAVSSDNHICFAELYHAPERLIYAPLMEFGWITFFIFSSSM